MKTSVLIATMALVASTALTAGEMAMATGATTQSRHAQAIDLALAGDTKGASRILRSLESQKLSADEKDRLQLSIGRVLYQAGDFEGALAAYKKVTPGSDSWFYSLEERAWAHMRLNQPDSVLSQLKTVLSPIFKERAKPEAYFLSALAHLRVCDYPKLFKDLDLFKERYRERVKSWQASESFDPKAAAQLKETKEVIQKLNIVEAEAIQRLYLDEDLMKKKGAPGKIVKRPGDLTFPMTDDEEVWLDEVNNIQVRVSGCPGSSKGGESL